MEYLVTSLKKLTNKRWLVYINYEPAFPLYEAELRKNNISENCYIDEYTYNQIVSVLEKRAKVRAMALLKNKDYTVIELTDKLSNSQYPKDVVDKTIEYVSGYGYLNDYRYASNYVAFKASTKSKKQIAQFLQAKGVEADTIERVFKEFYSEDEDVELNQVVQHMQKKLSKMDYELNYEEKVKLISYYCRKGFSSYTVKKALDIVVERLDNN